MAHVTIPQVLSWKSPLPFHDKQKRWDSPGVLNLSLGGNVLEQPVIIVIFLEATRERMSFVVNNQQAF